MIPAPHWALDLVSRKWEGLAARFSSNTSVCIMPESSSLVLVCCICVSLSSLLAPAEGAQCTVHPDHKCQATCNGTTFDISKIFGYP